MRFKRWLRLKWLFGVLVFAPGLAHAATYGNLYGFCETGGVKVVTGSLQSTTKVQASYPSCTITVYVHGGGIASIFSSSAGAALTNPFTANSDGSWQFYAANGNYDYVKSGGGLASPLTISNVALFLEASQCPSSTAIFCQGGNSFGATAILGPLDAQSLTLLSGGVATITTNQASGNRVTITSSTNTGGQTLTLSDVGHPGIVFKDQSGARTIGTVGDRGTSGNMSLHSNGGGDITIPLGSAEVDITHGSASSVFDSSGNLSVNSGNGGIALGQMTTANTGSIVTPASGHLQWGSVVIAGVTVPVVKDSLGNQTQLGSGGGGSGTVTSVTAGDVGVVATTSVATGTTTPAITYVLKNAAPYSFLGNATNASAITSFNVISGVATKTASYTVLSTDYMKLLSVSNAGAQTLTLPGTVPAAGWQVSAQNTGAGTWTIDPNGHNLDGAAGTISIATNAGMIIRSDGSNYFTFRGNASSGSGCAAVDPSACILKGSAANSGLNNDVADIYLGLLSAHNVGIAANSALVALARSSGDLLIGLASSDISGTSGQVIAGTVYGLATATTNASTGGFGIAAPSKVYLNSSHSGSGSNLPISIEPAGAQAILADTSQRVVIGSGSIFGTTTRLTVNESAGQFGIVITAPAGSTANEIFSVNSVANGAVYADGSDFNVTTNGSASATIKMGTGAGVTTAMTIGASQKIGIGVAPDAAYLMKLDTTSALMMFNRSGTNWGRIDTTGTQISFLSIGSVNARFGNATSGADFVALGGSPAAGIDHGGTATTFASDGTIIPPTVGFFTLPGAPSNGAIIFCSDCTIASPCNFGGTGALAKRLNGAWVCN